MLPLFSFVHLFIPPPSFWFPLVVLEETTNFGGSIQQGALQLWPSWLNVICSISICARSGGNCSCSSLRVYLEDRLEQSGSSWVPELPGSDVGKELVFLLTGVVSGEAAHYCVVLFDSFFLGGDFHIADCTAEILGVEYVSIWVTTRAVCDHVCVSLLEPGVANAESIGYGEFQDSLTFHVADTKDYTLAEAPTWPFQSPTGISISVAGTLATAHCSWS